MITYTWKIISMNTKPQEGDLMDVVVNVNWGRTAISIIETVEYTSYQEGQFTCSTPSETDFTAYPELTYEQVCGWLNAGMDVAELDAYLASQIENTVNPPIIILPNPWETPNTETIA